MAIKTILEENICRYSDHVDEDVAENMGRMFYRGIADHDPDDDRLLSLLIWELKTAPDSENTESELKWIYAVNPSFLTPLLEGYHKEALNENIRRSFFESTSLEKEKEAAFDENGFSLKEVESRDIRVTVDECMKLSIARKQAPSYIQCIALLDDQEFYQGLMNILFRYDNPSLEDLAFLPKHWYEQSVSCFVKTDGKVNGFLLVHACPSGTLVPILFFAVGADARMNLVEMMRFSIRKAAEIYPGDTVIRIHRRNPEVSALSGKLFPGKKGESAIAGERSEQE